MERRRARCNFGIMAEWLRRQTRNLMGYALVGSNPADVVKPFLFFFELPLPSSVIDVGKHHASIVQG